MVWSQLAACVAGFTEDGVLVDCTLSYLRKSVTASLPATAAASSSLGVYAQNSAKDVLVVQVAAAASPGANYTLELFDGDPLGAGVLIYQATGITLAEYTDSAPFFVEAPASGTIYSRITNIDSVAVTVEQTIRLLELNPAV